MTQKVTKGSYQCSQGELTAVTKFNLYQKLNFPTALTKAKFHVSDVTYLYLLKFNKLTIVKKQIGRAGRAFKLYIPVACQLAIVVLS